MMTMLAGIAASLLPPWSPLSPPFPGARALHSSYSIGSLGDRESPPMGRKCTRACTDKGALIKEDPFVDANRIHHKWIRVTNERSSPEASCSCSNRSSGIMMRFPSVILRQGERASERVRTVQTRAEMLYYASHVRMHK